MQTNTDERYLFTQNRELSWLRFDRRVLEEAKDSSVPELERLRFVSIFSSNLDEFFMVRVGSLFDIERMSPDDIDNKTGMTAKKQLKAIYRAIPELLRMKKHVYNDVMDALSREGVRDVPHGELSDRDRGFVGHFFRFDMLPLLTPMIIAPNHPATHFVNKRLYAAAMLENKKGHSSIGIVPVPSGIPPFVSLEDRKRFVRSENILLHRLPELFCSYTVKESCVFAVTRNADISFDEEKFEDSEEDLRRQMKKLLKQRDQLSVVRLELSRKLTPEFREKLSDIVKVETKQVFVDTCPLNMGYVSKLIDAIPPELSKKLTYPPYSGRFAEDLLADQPLIPQIRKKDRMLFYPYDSVEPFLRLLSEAAQDPRVVSIKIAIYRLASSSKIAQTLCQAARNGKEVLVLMELRARFDEENNLAWSTMLEESGCQVIYGMEGFKCHSKICLITLRDRDRTSCVTQIGTGNYNEKTNAMYTDLSLMTADRAIGEDAAAFFRNMLTGRLDGEYSELRVSPFGIKSMLLQNIDRQIRLGEDGYIRIKANAVTEREVIDKLVEASRAGVRVELIIRGICCILPGIPGYTENIHVTSIVGRFLEHGRVYQFGKGADAEYYISSADLMTRNLNRRVEIACPVRDAHIRAQLEWMLDTQQSDNVKAGTMLPDGSYERKRGDQPLDSQEYFMERSPHIKAAESRESEEISRRVRELIDRYFWE